MPRVARFWQWVPKGLANLTRLFLSFVLTLCVLEICVRIFMPQDTAFFDSSKIVRFASVSPWLHENIPNGRNEFFVGVPVHINSLGFRGGEVAIPKPPHTIRIVGVGDSITFGYGIRLEDTFLQVLEADLNRSSRGGTKYEVLNAGVPATGLDYYFHFLSTQAARLEPDFVVIGMCLNDIKRYGNAGPRKPESLFTLRGFARLLARHSQLFLAAYTRAKSFLYARGILDVTQIEGGDFLPLEPPSHTQEEAWNSTLQMLSRVADLARQRNYRMILVLFPMEPQLSPDTVRLYRDQLHVTQLGPGAVLGEPQQKIAAFGSAHGLPVLDLLPAFRAVTSGTLYLRNRSISYDPVHPSVLGHRIAAEHLFRYLSASSLCRNTLAIAH